MAVTKRVRFEVLRRDNHQCRYCGATAPEATLVVDHVLPVALGGSDAPSNLVAACRDCNAGKTSTSPDATVVEAVSQDALRWAQAMKAAAQEFLDDSARAEAAGAAFLEAWNRWTINGQPVWLPADWHHSVAKWLAVGLPMQTLLEDIPMTMTRSKVVASAKFTYLAGVAWKQVAQMQERASELLAASGRTEPPCEGCGRHRGDCDMLVEELCLFCDEPWAEHDYERCCLREQAFRYGYRAAADQARKLRLHAHDVLAYVVDKGGRLDPAVVKHLTGGSPSQEQHT